MWKLYPIMSSNNLTTNLTLFLSAAWVSSITIGAICFLGPVSSTILNRFGIRVTTILGCLSCAVGLALGSFAPNITILYITFSLPFGAGVSAIYVVSPIIVYQYFLKKRSFALGIVTAGQGMGTMILGPTLQALVDVFGWKNSFRLFAGILAVASLTGVILHRKSTSSVLGEEDEARGKKFGFNLWLLRDPVIITIVLRNGLTVYTRLVPYVHIVSIRWKFSQLKFGVPGQSCGIWIIFLYFISFSSSLSVRQCETLGKLPELSLEWRIFEVASSQPLFLSISYSIGF